MLRPTFVIAGLFAALIVPRATAQKPPLKLVVTTQLEGHFAAFQCEGPVPPSDLETRAAQIAGEPEALAIDTGDLLGASVVTRRALSLGSDGLARAIAATRLRALAVGHRDLAASRETLINGVRALAQAGVPAVLSNLHCDATAHDLCDTVVDAEDPPVVLDTPSGKVAYIVLVAPSRLQSIAHDRSAGLMLDPPADALRRGRAAAVALGAQWVVATYDGSPKREEEEALALVDAVKADRGADILLVNELHANIRSLATTGGTTIVETRDDRAIAIDTSAPQLVRDAASGTASPEVVTYSGALRQSLCKERRPFVGGSLLGPLSREAFTDLFLDVLREQVRGEVAVINRAAVHPDPFPILGALDDLSVQRALPFDDTLWVGQVPGSDLRELALSPRADRLQLRGLQVVDKKVLINGRKIDDDFSYRVVTTGFIADGGEGGLPGTFTVQNQFGSPADVLIAWLSRPRSGDITQAPVDPAKHTRWELRFALDTSFSTTDVTNAAQYADSQLSRGKAQTFRMDAETSADAGHPRYAWENSLRIRYALERTIGSKGDSGFLATSDLITARDMLVLRRLFGKRSYAPQPFVESFVESEFYPPEKRTYQHLEWRPVAGLRFRLLDRLSLYASVGMDWETLKPGSAPTVAVVGGWKLTPCHLFQIGSRAVEGESTLDVALSDPGSANDLTIRFTGKILFPIFKVVSLMLAYDLYGRKTGAQEIGISSDAVVGLHIGFISSRQAYRY